MECWRRRMRISLCLLFVLAACGDDDGGMDAGPGEGGVDAPMDGGMDAGDPDAPTCTVGLWDPSGEAIHQWPDPTLLAEDSATGTGYRLDFNATGYDATAFRGYAPLFTEDLDDLDGFGANAHAYFRFGRAFDTSMLPTAEATESPDAGLGIVVLADTPYLQRVLTRSTDDDATLMLGPMEPLPEATWTAAFVTRALTDAAGGCLEPSGATQALLDAPDARTQEAIDALVALEVITSADDLVALAVTPVQTLTDDSRAVAEDIVARDYVREAEPVCTDEELFVRCETSFVAWDFRGADGVLSRNPGDAIAPSRRYELPITAWLPKEGTAPFPTIVWGSGLGSGREQGQRLATFAAPAGFATVAIDPVAHGEHPDVGEGEGTSTIATVVRFFTIGDQRERALEPLRMRDNFRQSSYDKLQLVRLLQAGLDATGDGETDLDADRLSYLGVSLGGIMGVELLALSDAFGAGVLVVPGGRVSSIISESSTFGPLIDLLRPPTVTDGDIDRFFPILQTILDRGDAGTYGPHVVHERFDDAQPSILGGVVLDDSTVPNAANYHLMRAMRLQLMAEELRPEPGIVRGPAIPVSGNSFDGAATAGFLQFDVVREGPGAEIEDASHDNVGDSEQGAFAWFDFLSTHYFDGLAVIRDPYVETGLEHE